MKETMAKYVSGILERIAAYFAKTASPWAAHRPELPEELK